MNKWQCEECGSKFKTKKALIEHLTKDHLEEAMNIVDYCIEHLGELGVKNPF